MTDPTPNGWPDAAARARRRVKALAMMGYGSMSAREVIEDLLDLWDYVHRGTGADEILAALDAAGLEVRPKQMDREKTLRRWVQATSREGER
jgi:isopentenyl diphosphate isomerase/L-lactate dehydrogenase-like FMN-dependent dehydrogenase